LALAFDRLIVFLAFLAGILLTSMAVLICYSVIMRYLFVRPQGWVVEIVEDSLLYITFLGTAWLLKKGGHVSVELVYERLSPKIQLLFDIFNSLMGLTICLIMTWYSAVTTWDHFQRGAVVVGTIRIPKAILLVVIPIGFFCLLVAFLKQTVDHIGCMQQDTKGNSVLL